MGVGKLYWIQSSLRTEGIKRYTDIRKLRHSPLYHFEKDLSNNTKLIRFAPCDDTGRVVSVSVFICAHKDFKFVFHEYHKKILIRWKREFFYFPVKKFLPDGESIPGLPHDRRGYSPLYYRGPLWGDRWIILIDNRCLREPGVLETILQVPLDRCLFYFRRKKILQTAPDKLVGVSKQQRIQSSLRAEGKIRYTLLYS